MNSRSPMTTFTLVTLVVAMTGCTTSVSAPSSIHSPLSSATSDPTTTASDPTTTSPSMTEAGSGFTPSITFDDCAQLSTEFIDWVLDPNGWSGQVHRSDVTAAIGAVVSSPSGDWAVFAIENPDSGAVPPVRQYAYITPAPPAIQAEIISVARISADTGQIIWGFDNYTSWRGEQQDLGRQAVEASFACLGQS